MVIEQRGTPIAKHPDGLAVKGWGDIEWHAMTHRGLVRQGNEDSFVAARAAADDLTPRVLLAVADGLGGHRGGSIASRMALEAVRREFQAWHSGSAAHLVGRAIRYANQEVFSAGNLRNEFAEMRTTVTAVVLEQDYLTVGHVGDCRLYRVRDGATELLTRDHSVANEMARLHWISRDSSLNHPGRHQLTRSVGSGPFLHIDVFRKQIRTGDAYLLCTDGLWSKMSLDDVTDVIAYASPVEACSDLLKFALKGGAPDNTTAIVFRVANVSKRPIQPLSWRSLLRMPN
jgi:protein phosphatase